MSQLKAVIFGAIGTIAETSDLQRQAFNAAFAAVGIDWQWDPDTYRALLEINGGQSRLRAYRDAEATRAGVTDLTIAKLHQAKLDQYVTILAHTKLQPRVGVVELIDACADRQIRVALCTSTTIASVAGIGAALAGVLPFDRFATIVTIDQIAQPKPAPDAYRYCLQQLGLTAAEVIAIEDTPVSIAAAQAAGIITIATPGATTAHQDFTAADAIVSDLREMTIDRLSALLQTQLQLTTHPAQ